MRDRPEPLPVQAVAPDDAAAAGVQHVDEVAAHRDARGKLATGRDDVQQPKRAAAHGEGRDRVATGVDGDECRVSGVEDERALRRERVGDRSRRTGADAPGIEDACLRQRPVAGAVERDDLIAVRVVRLDEDRAAGGVCGMAVRTGRRRLARQKRGRGGDGRSRTDDVVHHHRTPSRVSCGDEPEKRVARAAADPHHGSRRLEPLTRFRSAEPYVSLNSSWRACVDAARGACERAHRAVPPSAAERRANPRRALRRRERFELPRRGRISNARRAETAASARWPGARPRRGTSSGRS